MPGGGLERRGLSQVGPLQQAPFAQVGMPVEEDPAVLGDAEAVRRGHRHGRLAAVAVTSSSALRLTGAAACGFLAATSVNGSNSRPMASAYSSRVCPSRARRAFSRSAYMLGASVSPWEASSIDTRPSSP